MVFPRRLLLCLVWLLSVQSFSLAQEVAPKRLQVYILAGQSNMVGHAKLITLPRLFVDDREQVRKLSSLVFRPNEVVTRKEVDAQIATMIARDELNRQIRKQEIEGAEAIAQAKNELAELQEQYERLTQAVRGKFAVSERVYVNSIADRNRRSGPLSVGFGASEEKIGPELGFGMSLAQSTDAPILLIKTSWGGKSLHYNFRPPSAGAYELSEKEQAKENAAEIAENAGLNYRLMMAHIQEVLASLPSNHPAYDEQAGFELAGFVWFQGFNDQFSPEFRDSYEQNLTTFIEDVRQDLEVPDLPFVIGVMGTGITKAKVDENAVSIAQRATAAREKFQGTVAAVESYELYDLSALKVFEKGWKDHFAEWCAVGSDRPYHYLGSGKFFVRFGDALATSMIGLKQ